MRWLCLLALCGCTHAATTFPKLPAQQQAAAPNGNVALDVQPTDAEVAVDGVMQGLGSDFDGVHGALNLAPGPHQLTVSHTGYLPQSLTLYASDDGRQVVQVVLQKQ